MYFESLYIISGNYAHIQKGGHTMKKVMSLVLVTIILLSTTIGINAALPDTGAIEPQWVNILNMTNVFNFNGINGTSTATVVAKSGATQVSGTLTVYKQVGSSWVYVDSDSDTSTSNVLVISLDVTGEASGYYKSVFDVSVTRNGAVETESLTSYANVSPNP